MNFPSLLLSLALTLNLYCGVLAQQHKHGFKHEAVDALPKQQVTAPLNLATANSTVAAQCPAPTFASPSILSIITPSPEATPVEVTSQSQVVTSWIPEMTWCVGPPIGLIATATLTGPPYGNVSTLYGTTIAGTGSCETSYYPTTMTVCATTLTGLASKVTVTDCDQEVTFSSECGFTLETPTPTSNNLTLITPAPTLRRMMTYWLAPWQSLTLGETPSDVDIKVCDILDDETLKCTRYQEVWEVFVTTQTTTTSRQVEVATTVTGPGTLMVETLQAYITDTVVFVNLTTSLLLETEIEIETTSKSKKLVTRPDEEEGPMSTKYVTSFLKYKSTFTA
jgi:hypothetical protein